MARGGKPSSWSSRPLSPLSSLLARHWRQERRSGTGDCILGLEQGRGACYQVLYTMAIMSFLNVYLWPRRVQSPPLRPSHRRHQQRHQAPRVHWRPGLPLHRRFRHRLLPPLNESRNAHLRPSLERLGAFGRPHLPLARASTCRCPSSVG
ncbi:hypothetical protein PR202_gb12494 [Eleusine coracana subsp. coracana]|uniref:Uncharacterized protein n=1 Tax=Eleusine coracana subsp. coracana TaxID=191504 RepID=A0AAV5ERI8_ELECO|nr:hypothetical protein PR202_gb12494 [Eleusine coracana subsp. coracana]